MIATIAAIAQKKFQRSYGNHFPAIAAITATTIAKIDLFYLSDRSDHMETTLQRSYRSDSNNTRMHCVPGSKIPKFPLLEDLSNPKSMGSLSFPSSFMLKSTHKYKKPTFKQESTIHSRHVEFDEWREECVRRRSPRPSFSDQMETINRYDR